jgi:chromosome segregation ATPase
MDGSSGTLFSNYRGKRVTKAVVTKTVDPLRGYLELQEDFDALMSDYNDLHDERKAAEKKLGDLRESIIELKEYAEERAAWAAETESRVKPQSREVPYLQEVSKRRKQMNEIVEHCLAALEENGV